ncbi:hypothetical protein K502DRAFT_291113 [Neoconidiobolus thromboides FSU 785]|nr:hypothetical protein K502DRAFT_291113 [Neoconidiobolus thromboides FSU 785]
MIEFNLNQIEDKIIELEKENCQIKRIKNEILICFNIDEHEITISFVMPDSYPLLNIELVGNRHPVIQEKKWRGWTLNSAAIFVTQNGTLIDSIKLFQKNVNLHFQGVEDCTICYSVIGVLDQCLPNKQCRTCKKKFHPACLFKWFKSSAQSTCPLCRNLF